MVMVDKAMEYIGKALLGVVSFFVYQIYIDFREVKEMVNQMVVSQRLDSQRIDYLQRDMENLRTQQAIKYDEVMKLIAGEKNTK